LVVKVGYCYKALCLIPRIEISLARKKLLLKMIDTMALCSKKCNRAWKKNLTTWQSKLMPKFNIGQANSGSLSAKVEEVITRGNSENLSESGKLRIFLNLQEGIKGSLKDQIRKTRGGMSFGSE